MVESWGGKDGSIFLCDTAVYYPFAVPVPTLDVIFFTIITPVGSPGELGRVYMQLIAVEAMDI